MRRNAMFLAAASFLLWVSFPCLGDTPEKYFKICVVDESTGRGVPLVELQTVSKVSYFTDSNGLVAFYEPGLMDQRVFFVVRSDGYEFAKDGFGYEGIVLVPKAGGSETIHLKRLNIAERLYRVTGEGIYRDTVLLGEKPPIRQPLLNAQVDGQDSVQPALYKGKIFWFWGDTCRPRYPLGQFQTSGATSLLPEQGGLSPEVGVDLSYFVDDEGFSKKMCPMERGEPILVWIDAVTAVTDPDGREKLICRYAQMKDLGKMLEHGLAMYNDQSEQFEKTMQFDVKEKWRFPQGHPVPVKEGGQEYLLFPQPFPVARVQADLEHVRDAAAYEALTCLSRGAKYDAKNPSLERDSDGHLVWGWKKDADPIGQKEEKELIAAGAMKEVEARFQLKDVETGQEVLLHNGSFAWNEFRQKWILIGVQVGGQSFLGEVWFAEADSPTGPWRQARKIVTHASPTKYTFYNPCHHPFFDQDGGRIIYFEGTYATTFSGNDVPTPRYDYNQVMYRLDLADPRLDLHPRQ